MNEELDTLTDKLLEVSMKLRAAESKLAEVCSRQEKELSKFAHNLKNPVGVISSFAEMLQGSPSMDEEKRAKYMEIIQSSSKFSLALVNSFQLYNKLQNGSVPFEIQTENYLEVIQEIILKASKKAAKQGQSIQFNSSCSDAAKCNIDKQQLSHALGAILENAMRFSNENSVISVDVSETESELRTTITDSGIGISEEDLPNLTKTFFTVNTYDEFKEKCIGLGLTQTDLILKEMGATLTFSSEIGKGTQVEILLKKA